MKLSLCFQLSTTPWRRIRSGGIIPRILNLGIRWMWVISFRPRLLYPQGKTPGTHWIRGCVGPRTVLDVMVKRKILSPCRESNPKTPIVQPVAQSYTDWAITALIKTGMDFVSLTNCEDFTFCFVWMWCLISPLREEYRSRMFEDVS
jgi:hypothetical protein